MSDRPTDLPELEDFAFRTFDKIRYRDTDRQGHVNNAVFSTFMETGRTEFLYDPANPLVDDGASFVIARLDISLSYEAPGSSTRMDRRDRVATRSRRRGMDR